MPTRNQSGKPEHTHQNKNRKRPKSNKKYEKAIKHFFMLEKREAKEGLTNWIKHARKMLDAKMTKYGITPAVIDKYRK